MFLEVKSVKGLIRGIFKAYEFGEQRSALAEHHFQGVPSRPEIKRSTPDFYDERESWRKRICDLDYASKNFTCLQRFAYSLGEAFGESEEALNNYFSVDRQTI